MNAVIHVTVLRQSPPGDAFRRLDLSSRLFHPDEWAHNAPPTFSHLQFRKKETKGNGHNMRMMLSDKKRVLLCHQIFIWTRERTHRGGPGVYTY